MSNALALIENIKPLELFSNNGLDPIIEKIEKEVKAEVYDISTQAGRDRIKSVAYKIAQTKTAIDKMGKELASEWRNQVKAVDAERGRAWDRLETLQQEIRKPLTEWEKRDEDRIKAHTAAITEISNLTMFLEEPTAIEIERRIARSVEISGSRNWDEFAGRAKVVHGETYDALTKKLEARKQYEAEQAELERLRREEAERKQREHEERLKAEAAAKAKAEAEAQAKREAEALAAKVKAEQEAAAKREAAARQEKADAEERARKAEEARRAAEAKADADRKAAAEKARQDALAAEERAKREAEAAAQREREKIEAEKKAEAEATAKREADKAHRKKINNEALQAMFSAISKQHTGNSDEIEKFCKTIIESITKGQVPHIKISY